VKVADRVAALEALLGRVRRNAALGRGGAPTEGDGGREDGAGAQAGAAGSVDVDEVGGTAGVVVRSVELATVEIARASAPSALSGGDLGDWSSLLERDLRDPSPASTPPPPPITALTRPRGSSPDLHERAPSLPPDTLEASPDEELSPPSPRFPAPAKLPELAPIPPLHPLPNPEERAPESELERAIREVADNPPSVDPRALWDEAAMELRGRRPTSPPREDAPSPAPAAPALPRAPLADELAPPPRPLTTSATVGEATRKRRRVRHETPPRVTTRTWVVALFVATAFAVSWALLRDPGTPTVPPSLGSSVVRVTPPAPLPATAPTGSAATSTSAQPAVSSGTSPSRPTEPADVPSPPPLRSPSDHGWIRVEMREPVDVYLQGVLAGPSGRWIEVACGMKNARMARPGNPPPGHSFPMWLGEARTIRVPCGGDVRVRWSLD
jgi:hypothetical protein